MLTLENHLGEVGVSKECLSSLIGYTASKCFGVVGLNDAEKKHGLVSIFRKADIGRNECVKLDLRDGKLIIGLHITVVFGTNIPTVADSLANKIRYTVEEKTGLEVGRITVYVDGMKA